MIPPTLHGMNAMECISTMQKAIRRNKPELAFRAAVELIHTSKNFNTMVANRLRVIAVENIDTYERTDIIPYVDTLTRWMMDFYTTDLMKLGKVKLSCAAAIRVMSAAPKCRIHDDMVAAISLSNLLDGETFEVPDWALDGHTIAGKRKGRGIDYFAEESTKLVPQPKRKNRYVEQSLANKARKKAGEKPLHEKRQGTKDLF